MGPNMASKQQEVVEVLESWEDFDETDILEQKLKNLITPSKSLEASNSLNKVPFKIILTGDDALRSQYVPPEPTVKILKRPTSDMQGNSENKVFQPKKTLQQREQEYAQARLRILGETDKMDETYCLQNKVLSSNDMDCVIRLPKGPDGTRGFNLRR